MPGNRFLGAQDAQGFSQHVHLDPALPVLAGQPGLQASFQAGFADEIAGLVMGKALGAQFLFGHLSQVADEVGGERTEGKGAYRPYLCQDAGEIDGVFHDPFQDRALDIPSQGYGAKTRAAQSRLPALLENLDIQFQQDAETIQKCFGIVHLLAQNRDIKSRPIVGQELAVPVVNAAARRNDGDVAGSIAFGQIPIMVCPDDLQVPEAQDEQQEKTGCAQSQNDEPLFQQGISGPTRIETHGRPRSRLPGRPEPPWRPRRQNPTSIRKTVVAARLTRAWRGYCRSSRAQ